MPENAMPMSTDRHSQNHGDIHTGRSGQPCTPSRAGTASEAVHPWRSTPERTDLLRLLTSEDPDTRSQGVELCHALRIEPPAWVGQVTCRNVSDADMLRHVHWTESLGPLGTGITTSINGDNALRARTTP